MKTDLHWEKIGRRAHHGICLPLSALRSKNSCGVGEFLDLIPLIDWCHRLNLDCIQLLPLNDSGDDPSPYNALSSCALDPLYLSLSVLPDAGDLLHQLQNFLALTQIQRIATVEVKHQKIKWLYLYFQRTFPSLSTTPAYHDFLKKNPWLETYALFKAFKDEYGGKQWQDWPLEIQSPTLKHFAEKRASIDFHCFIQFHCFSQMENVRAYATSRNVFLEGDIPILLSPDSADVWAHRSLFKLDLAAGAPPDLYNPLGQKWGFPLYDWDAMRQTEFSWWSERLQVAERLFHLYRIDHVVGFFRIWAIPEGKKPIEGFFVPSDASLWEEQGREILKMMVDACLLLPIAEDLGTIPPPVRPLLRELGICSTKVVRWERRWQSDRNYIPFSEYEPFSLTTVSTPDMDTLASWWKKYPDEAIPFAHFMGWDYQPELPSEKQLEILRAVHRSASFFHINLLQEYLALFPELVWPNSEDERINVPGTLLPTNWTYRFRPYVEEILSHEPLAEAMKKIVGTA